MSFEKAPYLEVWATPVGGHEYVVGADVAEGLVHGDYSSLFVFDRHTRSFVAEWHGHIDSDLFSGVIWNVCRWYNDATAIPEDNGPGQNVVLRLKEVYWNLFVRKVPDAVQGILHDVYGYRTTWRSKPVLVDGLKQYLRQTTGSVPLSILDECGSYIYDDRGKTNAQTGTFDDRVIAAALCLYGDVSLPAPSEIIKKPVTRGQERSEWAWRELRLFSRRIEDQNAERKELQTIDEMEEALDERDPDDEFGYTT